jgi:hypothetical protein
MKTYADIGIRTPKIYLPNAGIDLTKWAVIACDQFTSQPEYWQEVEQFVGEAPSTLNLILPEVYLDQPGKASRIQRIRATMQKYLGDGTLQPHDGMVYVERRTDGKARKGLLLCLDLEQYEYRRDSTSLVRATEGFMIERVHPRVEVRQDATLELPHILVLIDDPERTVIEPLEAAKTKLDRLYDFDLMLGSGHLTGYAVGDTQEAEIVSALRKLAQPEVFSTKYGVGLKQPVMLFAMGDGNHSLATAKTVWEKMKAQVGMDHPARYALVEIENVHDKGLAFEPIHRVLFGLKRDLFAALKSYFGANFTYLPVAGVKEMTMRVDQAEGSQQVIGLVGAGKEYGVIGIANPSANLPVGTLQAFLDLFMDKLGAEKMDYVHGQDVVCELGGRPGNAGFYLPVMGKPDLFKTVILDGALPRKAFSMGEAREKRFYMEARKIL